MTIPTEEHIVQQLKGIMEHIKRQAGPALGLLRKHYPKSGGIIHEIEEIYEKAKWVQDQVEKL